MIFYKDGFNKWHKEDDFLAMANIFTGAMREFPYIEFLKRSGCIQEEKHIEHPSVVDFLFMGMRVEAIKRYRDIHKCDLLEAKNMVDQIEKDMEDMKNGK